eukprot:3740167-Rhodomonas_salina.3
MASGKLPASAQCDALADIAYISSRTTSPGTEETKHQSKATALGKGGLDQNGSWEDDERQQVDYFFRACSKLCPCRRFAFSMWCAILTQVIRRRRLQPCTT